MGMGKDHTLFALKDGIVTFRKKKNNKSYVSIEPIAQNN
jgi:large subunit ribosomal protein L27